MSYALFNWFRYINSQTLHRLVLINNLNLRHVLIHTLVIQLPNVLFDGTLSAIFLLLKIDGRQRPDAISLEEGRLRLIYFLQYLFRLCSSVT